MHYSTHVLIAEGVYRSVYDKHKISLNNRSLKYGSIKPDIINIINGFNLPHYKSESFDFICMQIEYLIEDTKTIYHLKSKEFSVRLGMILHFLADYFCLAHNLNSIRYNIITHMVYERNLGRYSHYKLVDNFRLSSNNKYMREGQNIKSFVNSLHNEYMSNRLTFDNDLKYATNVCIEVAQNVVAICMAKAKHAVA